MLPHTVLVASCRELKRLVTYVDISLCLTYMTMQTSRVIFNDKFVYMDNHLLLVQACMSYKHELVLVIDLCRIGNPFDGTSLSNLSNISHHRHSIFGQKLTAVSQ
jgi:hypothetical protein